MLVASGTYFENLTISPVQNGVVLRSESGPEVTTIDGQQLDRVFRCFGVGPGTAIEGFSIVHGRAGPNDVGAGLYLAGAHLRLENNIVRDNLGAAGAGLFVDFSFESTVILDCNDLWGNAGPITPGFPTKRG